MNKPHDRYSSIIFDIGQVLVQFDQQKIIQTIFNQPLSVHLLSKEQLKIYRDQAPHVMPAISEGVQILNYVRKKGFKTYVLSNMIDGWYAVLSQRYPFFNQFDGVILSCHVNAAKPDPDIYYALLRTYNLKPEECLFLDDKEENIVAGQALGIDGIVCQDHQFAMKTLKNLKIIDEMLMNITMEPVI